MEAGRGGRQLLHHRSQTRQLRPRALAPLPFPWGSAGTKYNCPSLKGGRSCSALCADVCHGRTRGRRVGQAGGRQEASVERRAGHYIIKRHWTAGGVSKHLKSKVLEERECEPLPTAPARATQTLHLALRVCRVCQESFSGLLASHVDGTCERLPRGLDERLVVKIRTHALERRCQPCASSCQGAWQRR